MSNHLLTQIEAEKYLFSIPEECANQPERLNNMLHADYVSVDRKALTCTIAFTVLPWELNRKGILHGGIISTMLDHTTAITVSCLTGVWSASVNLNVSFLSQGHVNDRIVATGKIVKAGRNMIFSEGSLFNESTNKIIATCTATNMLNVTPEAEK